MEYIENVLSTEDIYNGVVFDVKKQTISNLYSTLLKNLFTVTVKTDAEYSGKAA